MLLFVLLVALLAVVALSRAAAAEGRAREAERRAKELRDELLELRAALGLPPSARLGPTDPVRGTPAPAVPPAPAPESAPQTPAASGPVARWPEDQQEAAWTSVPPPGSPAPGRERETARPAGWLWGPEFSRARISVFGGALVLGGLAWTLRALGLPAWTLLLTVFAFGGVLYGAARRVPWPVSGALRGLGYGVTALGLGSLAQKLPGAWGPGAVLLGLLALSGALTWDGLRRREPLLGVMAAAGATLSVWLLADDLGRWSVLALGAVSVLVTAAVGGMLPHLHAGTAAAEAAGTDKVGTDEMNTDEVNTGEDHLTTAPDAPQTWRAALTLLLGVAGTLPAGWLLAALSHAPPGWTGHGAGDGDALNSRDLLAHALHVADSSGSGVLPWLVFAGLALLPPLTLLRAQAASTAHERAGAVWGRDAGLRLGAAWATLLPQALLALAVGVSLSGPGERSPLALGAALLALLGLSAAAWWAWHRARPRSGIQAADTQAADTWAAEATLTGTLSSSLTAGAVGVAASLLVTLLGARTELAALAALAGTLLLVGLYGHSRLYVWAGAVGLGLTALWGLALPLYAGGPALFSPVLRVLPALLGLAGALRAAQWRARHPHTPPLTWLAGLCSAALVPGLEDAGRWAVLLLTLALAGVAWLAHRSPGLGEGRSALYWAALPGLLLGGGWLLVEAGSTALRGVPCLPLVLGSGAAALSALLTAPLARRWQTGAEVGGLVLLACALALLPGTNTPQIAPALAVTALAAALLPLRLRAERVTWPLLAGLAGLAWAWYEQAGGVNPQPLAWLGAWLLLLAAWLTQDDAGRRWLAARVPAPHAAALRSLPRLPSQLQTLWFAAFLGAAVTAGAFLWPLSLRWWLLAGSAAVLLLGVSACGRAARSAGDPDARDRWTVGLGLVIAAGLKGALLDAAFFPAPAVVMGLAVLVTGLGLLLLAILAPRPRPPADGPQAPAE